jgi:disulfide bond formation protein DsbB
MLGKISIVVYIIAAVLHYTNGQMNLFWLSVVLGIATTGLGTYMSYYHVSPQLREYRETVYQMEADGASDDEILEFMDQDTDVDESKLINAPLWMNIVVTIGIVASFVLFVLGGMDRIR